MNKKEEKLLKNKYPQLLKEWDKEKNKDIDMNTVSFASAKRVHWICPKNHRYETTIVHRTRIDKNGKLPECKECYTDSLRVHDKEKLITHMNTFISNTNLAETGDATENYVEELLISMNCYKNVTNLGNIAATSDISVTDDNNTYYVQVKTITYRRKDSYYMEHTIGKYPDDMLMIMINKDRTRFALEFAGNIKVRNLSLTYDKKNSIYKNIMYTNVDEFKDKLKELIPLSRKELEFSSENIKKEYEMLQRFETFCVKNNIKYLRNVTNNGPVDGTINGYTFQAKYSGLRHKTSTRISSHKAAGSLNGKQVSRPYEVGDFNYFVVELGSIEESKYHNNFCIIPESVLIKQNILKSNKCEGKQAFSIYFPDYNKHHWSKTYWNNIPIELKDDN